MILTDKVLVKWNNTTRQWYEDRGYYFTKNNDEFEVSVLDLHHGSLTKIECICDRCKTYRTNLAFKDYIKNVNKNGLYSCSNCSNKYANDRVRAFYFLEIQNRMSSLGYDLLSRSEDYIDNQSVINYVCKKHGLKQTNYRDFICRNCICPECATENATEKLKHSICHVIQLVESKNNNILLNPEDYKNFHTKNLKIICGSCSNVFTTSLAAIEASDGHCLQCGLKICNLNSRLSKEEVEKRINKINGNKLLNPEDYEGNDVMNLRIQCSCGNIFVTSLADYEYSMVNRCKICSNRISKGEYKVMTILDKYKISYEPEYKFFDCKDKRPLPFDFYLKEHNLIIEYDGGGHYFPIFGEESFIKTQKHDLIKNKYCKDHNIKLIRIPYWEFDNIEEIIVKELNLNKIKYIKYPFK